MSLLTQNSNMLKEILFSTLMAATLLQAHAQKMVVGSCTLKDGGIYTGELVSGKPGGKGRVQYSNCLLYTSPSPRDRTRSRMPSSA